jgi:hypothetical protein
VRGEGAALAYVAPLGALHVQMPEPVVDASDEANPEHQALLADSVGLAL